MAKRGPMSLNVPQWERTTWGDMLRIAGNPREHFLRKYLFRRHLSRSPWSSALPRSTGLSKLENFALPGTREVVDYCRRLLEERIAQGFEKKKDKKPYRQTIAGSEDLLSNELISRYILSTPILAIAAGYLSQIPLLQEIELWRSRPHGDWSGSQFYHQDGIDKRQAKFFLFVKDVTTEDGPVTLLPAPESRRLRAILGYRGGRLKDNVVFKHVDKASEVALTGKAGDLALADTSRCLHFGSRCQSGERWTLMFHFTTHLAGEKRNSDPAALPHEYQDDPVRRLVLSTSL